MSLRKGIVVEVHPEDHSVDIVMSDDASRLVGVQVITGNGSTRSGTSDLPEIPKRKDKWDISTPTGQDMHAIVGFFGRHPVVLGFIYPQVNQMLHKDPQLRIDHVDPRRRGRYAKQPARSMAGRYLLHLGIRLL